MHIHLFGIPWDELAIAAYIASQCAPSYYLGMIRRFWNAVLR